jgi:rRNA maturation endonuclease Nob1
MNNLYCEKCSKEYAKRSKEPLRSETDICPICGGSAKIIGKAVRITTTNGPFKKHI